MHREAVAELRHANELSNSSPAIMMQLGFAYAIAGKKSDARKLLAEIIRLSRKSYVPSFYVAAIRTGLGETDSALELLSRAHEERCDYLVHLAKEPGADPLRRDPRFDKIVPRPRPTSRGY
jgi:tetratricopeptide (TPR) repeat protein